MIRAALINLNRIGETDRKRILSRADQETGLRYAESFSRKKGVMQAVGHDLLRSLLAYTLDIPIERIRMNHTGKGRPILTVDGVSCERWPYASLSHSRDMAVACIADEPVGCDIEIARICPPQAVRGFFSEADASRLAEYPGMFTRLWVRRESLIKVFGGSVDTKALPLFDTNEVLRRTGCRFYEGESKDGVLIEIASKTKDPKLQIEWEKKNEYTGG